MTNEHVRISDAERNNAMTQLGAHFAAGRITLPEYEERCDQIVRAMTVGELRVVFRDLPAMPDRSGSYTVSEIDELRRRNAKPKAAILGLTVVGSMAAAAVLQPVWELSGVLLFLIPTVFLLLYVMKVGPKEWYLPNPRQLERQRLRELQTRAKMRELEMRQESRARQHELANQAIDLAQGFLKRK